MKLPHKLSSSAFAAYMAGIIAFVVSAALTLINTGMAVGYLSRVLNTYAVAFPVAFTGVVIFRPFVLFLVRKTVQSPPSA